MSKFLDILGVQHLWNKVKKRISDYVNEHKNIPNGIAGLDSSGKLNPAVIDGLLKKVNNESLVGEGNITLDLSLYKVVESLPTDNIDANKIYLVLDSTGVEGNLYTEYAYTNGKWEQFGQYKANVDLTEYTKFSDTVSASKNGVLPKEYYTALELGYVIKKDESGFSDSGINIALTKINNSGKNNLRIPYATTNTGGLIDSTEKNAILNLLDSCLITRSDKNFYENSALGGLVLNLRPATDSNSDPGSTPLIIPYASETEAGIITSGHYNTLNDLSENSYSMIADEVLNYSKDSVSIPVVVPGSNDVQNILLESATNEHAGVITSTEKKNITNLSKGYVLKKSSLENYFSHYAMVFTDKDGKDTYVTYNTTTYAPNNAAIVDCLGIPSKNEQTYLHNLYRHNGGVLRTIYINNDELIIVWSDSNTEINGNIKTKQYTLSCADYNKVGLMHHKYVNELDKLNKLYAIDYDGGSDDFKNVLDISSDGIDMYLTSIRNGTEGNIEEDANKVYITFPAATSTKAGLMRPVERNFIHNLKDLYSANGYIENIHIEEYGTGALDIQVTLTNIINDSYTSQTKEITIPLVNSLTSGLMSPDMYKKLNDLNGGGNKIILKCNDANQIKSVIESLDASAETLENAFTDVILTDYDGMSEYKTLRASVTANVKLNTTDLVFTAHTDTQLIILRVNANVSLNNKLAVDNIKLETRDLVYTNETITNIG